MRILLVGEYSRLHNSLKEGLQKHGHEVVLLGAGDGFKNYPVDIYISHSFKGFFLKKLRTLIYKLTSIDLGSLEIYSKVKRKSDQLANFDVVQLINESSIKTKPRYEIKFLKHILLHNKKVFVLSSGVDHISMTYMMDQKPRYSLMQPYIKDPSLKKTYQFQLAYLDHDYKELHAFIMKNCNGVIATDMDYHLPYKGLNKYLGLIPNPINIDLIRHEPLVIDDKIKIFHGVNTIAKHKKGNDFFFEALEIIKSKYDARVDIKTVYSLPYSEYIEAYNDCHILLDQVYAYDQGYNALEAMAKGKVVFTGAEKEWLDYYDLEEDTVAINALPDAEQIAMKLEWLILNPDKILDISKNARSFIEKEHNYKLIADKYVEVWNNN